MQSPAAIQPDLARWRVCTLNVFPQMFTSALICRLPLTAHQHPIEAMGLPAGAATQDIVGSIANENGDLVAPTGAVDNAAAAPATDLAQTTAATEGQASAIAPNPANTINGQSPLMGQASANANATPPSSAAVPQAAQTANATFDKATGTWTPGAEGFATGPITDTTGGGYLNGILNFTQKNPLATYGLIQGGGSLVGGMFSPITPAQVSALDAQAANNRAAAGLTSQQTANIQSGIPTTTRIPQQVQQTVTGAPVGTGLINQPRGANVTGTI